MKPNDLSNQLVHLPRRFNDLGSVSMYDLVKETGYFEAHEKILEADIRAALKINPELVNDWIMYSADKRTASGWYFKKEMDNYYVIGFSPARSNKLTETAYTDEIAACASFIKHEVESIRCS